MAFYGFTPQPKQYGGIGRAIGYAGQAIGAGIDQAVQASKDWKQMENAIKGIRGTYQQYGKSLMEKGALSQEAYQLGLDRLRLPTEADKANPQGYIEEMQQRASEAFKVFAGKEDMLLKKERAQTVQRIGGQAAEGMATTVGTQRFGAPAQTEGTQPGQYTSERAAPGFQTYQPQIQKIGGAETQEEAVARTERGLAEEGQMPLSKEEVGTVERMGGLPTREEVAEGKPTEATELQKKRLALDEAKFAWQKSKDTIQAGKATPEQYDKGLNDAIDNKFKAKSMSRQYTNLFKAVEAAVNKAKGGAIDQLVAEQLRQQFIREGETPPEMTVPALEALLPQLEKDQKKADKDVLYFEEVVKAYESSPKPTLIGAHREARERILEREFPAKIEEIGNMRGFGLYGAQDPMISKTGEINVSHPKIQEAIKQKLKQNYTIDEIAKGLQEETAYIGKM